MAQFSELSLCVTKQLNKEEKKKFGIFITPEVITSTLFSSVLKHANNSQLLITKILEPSCGTCEMVYTCDKYFNDVQIDGIELNDTIYDAIKDLSFRNNVTLTHADFIKMDFQGATYDFIIGNPPYCVCEKGYPVDALYEPYIVGRPNTFGLFLLKAISLLKENGILAFVVSRSCLNAAYYAKIRNYIKATCNIVELIDFEEDCQFIDTQQSTVGLIVQKKKCESPAIKRIKSHNNQQPPECKYSVLLGENYIFTLDASTLNSILEGATTLKNMGLRVRTGSVVWNQVKKQLTTDATKTMLIYNSNVTPEYTVEPRTFSNAEKKQYIELEGKTEQILVVNRGNGNAKYRLQYALIEAGTMPYLVENHLNEIYYDGLEADRNKLFETVAKSFQNPKTQLFINFYLGNNGLSKTELETILPIYL